ncbi:hypothetical protein ACQ86O_27300 (plasmid) [Serratia sp. L9]|uniref:hypothetical protein n=1 Tax=Serratia sp. L9 TaxID=3423946 RepID=UPI003D673310
MKKPQRLSVIASLFIGGGIFTLGYPTFSHAEAAPTRIYTVRNNTSLYQFALQSGLQVAELRRLNNGSLHRRDTLKAGESLLLPADSPLFPMVASNALVSNLPELGMGNEPLPETDATAMKVAGAAQTVGAQDWNSMTGEQVKNQAEGWAKNQAKGQLIDPLQQQAQGLLGKFGKAQVGIAVDDRGISARVPFPFLPPGMKTTP